MRFTKMHGCGNDYIYVNCLEEFIENRSLAALRLSDRHFGIGSDGMICIDSSDVADFKMDMYNADGSQGKMCGNGIRCVGKYVYDYGLTSKTCITIETLGGIKTLQLTVTDGKVSSVRVCMGSPDFSSKNIPVLCASEKAVNIPVEVYGNTYTATCVSMGNPHAVIFVEDVDGVEIEKIGPMFENHPMFPERINTEFVQVLENGDLKMRVWERGSGETLACGTGTCAALAASYVCGCTLRSANVYVRGGVLSIEWSSEDDMIYMTGPAEIVFEGEMNFV